VTSVEVAPLRRTFSLPDEDVAGLVARGVGWETVTEGNTPWLIVHDQPLPQGFRTTSVDIAIMIPTGYPDTALDMVRVSPPMVRLDGAAIPATSPVTIDQRSFQQWSRHRTPANPWRSGVDSVLSQLDLAQEWFARAAPRA
jgi:hypothetical protein